MCLRAKLLQSCPTLCDPMDCSLPSLSVHGIHQARILECVVIPFFSSLPLAAPGKPKALYVCLVAQSYLTLQPHGLQHSRASLSITNSRSLLRLMSIESLMPSNHLIPCHLFSSCLQSFPASGSFPSWLLASGGQSIGVSASASVLLLNIQDSFPLGWTGLISLQSKGLSRVCSKTTV